MFQVIYMFAVLLSMPAYGASAAGAFSVKSSDENRYSIDIDKNDFKVLIPLYRHLYSLYGADYPISQFSKDLGLTERSQSLPDFTKFGSFLDERYMYAAEVLKKYSRRKLEAMNRWAKTNQLMDFFEQNMAADTLDYIDDFLTKLQQQTGESDLVKLLTSVKATNPEFLSLLANSKVYNDKPLIINFLQSAKDQQVGDNKEIQNNLIALLGLLPEIDWSLEDRHGQSTLSFLCDAIASGLVGLEVLDFVKFDGANGDKRIYKNLLEKTIKEFIPRLQYGLPEEKEEYNNKYLKVLSSILDIKDSNNIGLKLFSDEPLVLDQLFDRLLSHENDLVGAILPYILIVVLDKYIEKRKLGRGVNVLATEEYFSLMRAQQPKNIDKNNVARALWTGYESFKRDDKKPLQQLLFDVPYDPELQHELCDMFSINSLYLLMEILLRNNQDKEKAYRYIAPCELHSEINRHATHSGSGPISRFNNQQDSNYLQHKKRFHEISNVNDALELLHKSCVAITEKNEQSNSERREFFDRYARKMVKELNNALFYSLINSQDFICQLFDQQNIDFNSLKELNALAKQNSCIDISNTLSAYIDLYGIQKPAFKDSDLQEVGTIWNAFEQFKQGNKNLLREVLFDFPYKMKVKTNNNVWVDRADEALRTIFPSVKTARTLLNCLAQNDLERIMSNRYLRSYDPSLPKSASIQLSTKHDPKKGIFKHDTRKLSERSEDAPKAVGQLVAKSQSPASKQSVTAPALSQAVARINLDDVD